jgi:hypothetical protein
MFMIASAHNLGTADQDGNPGPEFDRQILACVAKSYWPGSPFSDPAVKQAENQK